MQSVFPLKFDDAEFLELEKIPNRNPSARKIIQIVQPDFSCVCPRSGYPDYGRVILRYIADQHMVELKSWKLYLACFYGVGVFHEEAAQEICDAFTEDIKPRWCSLTIDWAARGGVKTVTRLVWTASSGYIAYPEHWQDDPVIAKAAGWTNS